MKNPSLLGPGDHLEPVTVPAGIVHSGSAWGMLRLHTTHIVLWTWIHASVCMTMKERGAEWEGGGRGATLKESKELMHRDFLRWKAGACLQCSSLVM